MLAPGYRYWFKSRDGAGESAAEHLRPGWDSELHATLRADSIGARGGHVTARVHEDNDFSRLIGHPGWDALLSLEVDEGGAIVTEVYQPLENAPSWRPYLQRALPWLREHRSAALDRDFAGGRLVESRESAREWRAMLKAWRQAMRRAPATP
jgi:hypothetical protein